ncbi:MAG TPA: amidohydrolase family protein [Polyangiaceae bacterium]|nr:amidohydrolase family protein [Polyangiaceae bacterium]
MLAMRSSILCAAVAVTLLSVGLFRVRRGPAPDSPPPIAFVDVTVVPMSGGPQLTHVNVLVRGDRIERIGAESPPAEAKLVDGRGKVLMPGLVDMHVHLPAEAAAPDVERMLLLWLLHGVTALRSMQGAPAHLALRASSRTGVLPSPELFLAGPPLQEELTPEAARRRVREQGAAGYDFVKVIGGFDRPAYAALVDEARKVGLPVVGHVPEEIGIDAVLAARQRSIEHLMGFKAAAMTSDSALAELARRTRAAGVYSCPTLNYFATSAESLTSLQTRAGLQYAAPVDEADWLGKAPPTERAREALQRLRREVLALQTAGAKLLVGSDAPDAFMPPGFGFAQEMRELIKAGMPTAAIMTAATRNAAEALGRGPLDGTVQPGAIADLILVAGDPLRSVDDATQPSVIVVRGRLWTRAQLEARLSRIPR